MYEQRIGYLYGYYSEDPNYPEGVRVNIEAIYEPPQVGDIKGVNELKDPKRHIVDMVAAGLGLERVGWIFTTKDSDITLTCEQLRKAAKLQQEHSFQHPLGFKVSKFVTVVVQPNSFGEIETKVYMVSEIGQELERDNCLAINPDKPNMVCPRVAGENEIVPPFLRQGTQVKEFEPEFLLVKLEQGQPKHDRDYGILKIHQPELYRGGKKG